MLHSLRTLIRHRALLRALTGREIRARYRGSVLGFLWSFLNPLLLLLVYTFVFRYVFEPRVGSGPDPYAVFLFTGILPWTWFATALLESANSIVQGGALLKKVVFPAEVLPLVAVLANGAHFLVALPILGVVLAVTGHAPAATWLALAPLLAVQLLLTAGIGLLVAALAVLFRDVRDLLAHLLTLGFFATPIIYTVETVPERFRWVLLVNPMSHVIRGYQDALFFDRWPSARGLLGATAVALVATVVGYAVFNRLRELFPEEV